MPRYWFRFFKSMIAAFAVTTTVGFVYPAEAQQPNILVIVADDMGYSDWGSFGGEIRTPNLDTLAQDGLRFTNFYAAPACSPSRSMLMTGIDHHMVGMGTMGEVLEPNQTGKPGYEGYLNDRAVALPQLLRDAGYATMMSGKWHLGESIEHGPSRKGFEQSFTLLEGGASHFGDEWMMYANYSPTYRENGERVHVPSDFYSSEFYTQKIIDWLKAKKDDRPFFAYLAYTAPHDPLHVPDEWLDKYSGVYDDGYDALSEKRLERMIDLGIVPKATKPSGRPDFIPAWSDLTADQKKRSARAMEIYAAMVENIDHHIGRLFANLSELGLDENTIVIFFSDNGANGATMAQYPQTNEAWVERNSDNRYENLGRRGSRIGTGPGWALASMTPFRLFKGFISEGGIRSPLIVAGPGVTRAGQINTSPANLRDIMPTVLQYVGVEHPDTYDGRDVLPMQGRSMVPVLAGRADTVHDPEDVFGFELLGWRGIRVGDWKATWIDKPFGVSEWELFNLSNDPGETKDLSGERPDKTVELRNLWERYASDVGVVLAEKSPLNAP